MKPENIDDVIDHAMTISKKQGSALVQAGLADLKRQYNDKLVGFVSGTMNQITQLTEQRDHLDNAIKMLKDRLSAINDGHFTVTPRGDIVFKENKLNAGLL